MSSISRYAMHLAALGLCVVAGAASAADDKATIERVLKDAYAKYNGNTDGKNADYIPALAKVPSQLFGIALVTVDGQSFSTGDADALFSIQSISKVFTLARVMQDSGTDAAGNSVRSQLAIGYVAEQLGANPYASKPH